MESAPPGRNDHSGSRRARDSRSRSAERRHERRRQRDRDEVDVARCRDGRDGDSREDRKDSARSQHRGSRRRSRSPRSPPRNSRREHDSSAQSRREYDDRSMPSRSTRDRSPYKSRGSERQEGATNTSEAISQISRKSRAPLPSQEMAFGKKSSSTVVPGAEGEAPEKQKPNFAPSGHLAAASNSVAQADGSAIVLKYHEPVEARKPPSKDEWKLFVFKGPEIVDTIELSHRSCWLVGREQAVVDLLAEHPSISKQHAVIQFRYIEKRNEYGDKLGRVRPYLIDLESANGSALNKERIPDSRYLELRDKDMIQFGHSTREYVLMLSPQG